MARPTRNSETASALPRNSKADKLATPVTKPLTEKELLLVENIANGASVYAAAIRAGYENTVSLTKNIYTVVQKPNVAAAIARKRAEVTAKRGFTREKAFDMLQEAFDMGKLMAEPMAMVGATREMIKMAGYNAPVKVDVNVNGSIEMAQLNRLTDTQLLELMSKTENVEALHSAAVPMLEDQSKLPENTPETGISVSENDEEPPE